MQVLFLHKINNINFKEEAHTHMYKYERMQNIHHVIHVIQVSVTF